MAGKNAGKFTNKWLIKTPPGYSCLFIKPMNRLEPRFDIIPGVVDTDTYVNVINFPFILNKKDEQFLIKKVNQWFKLFRTNESRGKCGAVFILKRHTLK